MATKRELSKAEVDAKLKHLAENNPNISKEIDPELDARLAEMRALSKAHEANKGNAAAAQTSAGFHLAANGHIPNKKFTLGDGRVLEMGPSRIPHMLITPAMFNARDTMDFKFRADLQAAKVMQYVRSIDGAVMPEPLGTWMEVANLMHTLGEMGCKAAFQIYELYWDDAATGYWSELKNS